MATEAVRRSDAIFATERQDNGAARSAAYGHTGTDRAAGCHIGRAGCGPEHETAKLNGIDPQAWHADLLRRIDDRRAARLDELLPWNWARATRIDCSLIVSYRRNRNRIFLWYCRVKSWKLSALREKRKRQRGLALTRRLQLSGIG